MHRRNCRTECPSAITIPDSRLHRKRSLALTISSSTKLSFFLCRNGLRRSWKEHAMGPQPQATIDDYKPANKLHVFSLQLSRSLSLSSLLILWISHRERWRLLPVATPTSEGQSATAMWRKARQWRSRYAKSQEDKDARETLQMLKQNKMSDAKDPIAIPTDLGYSSLMAARRCSLEGV
ncbi:hypothetical protein Cni_G06106 [Canna indica]|uniref:Uncharacterized protein n=1 Tax=Canna indica TaxID=4628 RepID=A0AAQ3JWG4_9LILI|nr:hypothetical protein Cni_G06106 [Canna indica]